MSNQEGAPSTGVVVEVLAPTVLVGKAAALAAKKKKLEDRTPEEAAAVREYEKETQKKHREKKQKAGFVFDSDTEPTKTDAEQLLADRGIKHPHVLELVYKALVRAASEKGIPANRFLFQNGIVKTLESMEKSAAITLEPIAADYVETELLNRAELYALFDTCIATHEQISFEQYLETRLRCKQDCWFLGKEILDKDLAQCHRDWADFFPKFNPTLQPGYTQKQAIAWLNEQSPEIKTFLLLASRSAFKSSFSHIWILSLILCQPSIRILLVSETKPLSKDFIGVIRSYFETTPGQETRFHRFFPEFTIPAGDGSVLSLEVPMRHLKLAQSITSTSMDSSVAGNRCDVALFDDGISSTSCGNDTQIQASINKYLALGKLVEVGGLKLVLGTPWAFNDLYNYIIEMADKEDSGIAYRIDPAFKAKKEAEYKLTPALLPLLVESDIESFLFPERLNWKFLRREIGTTTESAAFFLSQNLCLFPKSTDSELRVTFEMEDLERHTKGVGFFETQTYTKVLSLDRAWSISKYADYSCLTVGTIQKVKDKTAAVIRDVKMDRFKESELVKAVCDMIAKHRDIAYVVAEKDRGYEDLGYSILAQLQMRGIPAPRFVWKPIPAGAINERMKAKRAKKLELPLQEGRLWFVTADWNEPCFKQLVQFNGLQKSNSTRKDDFVDTLGLFWENFGPKSEYESPTEKTIEEKREEEIERNAERARQMHARMFMGRDALPNAQRASDFNPNRQQPSQPPPTRQLTPREQAMQMMLRQLPPGMRARRRPV